MYLLLPFYSDRQVHFRKPCNISRVKFITCYTHGEYVTHVFHLVLCNDGPGHSETHELLPIILTINVINVERDHGKY